LGAAWIASTKSTPTMVTWNVLRMVFFMLMPPLICAFSRLKFNKRPLDPNRRIVLQTSQKANAYLFLP